MSDNQEPTTADDAQQTVQPPVQVLAESYQKGSAVIKVIQVFANETIPHKTTWYYSKNGGAEGFPAAVEETVQRWRDAGLTTVAPSSLSVEACLKALQPKPKKLMDVD
jgi:hypothetical protein